MTTTSREEGMSLVSLIVTLVLGLLVSLAAMSTLGFTRAGFNSVDTTARMQDNVRLATLVIQRLATQAGFKDIADAAMASPTVVPADTTPPDVMGFDNATPSIDAATGTITASSIGATATFHGSDTLILRYQPAENTMKSGESDGTMIDCIGSTLTMAPRDRADRRAVSIFFVSNDSNGIPNLRCRRIDTQGNVSNQWSLVEGVESFQVLYGVDAVTATPNTLFTGALTTVPSIYLYASQFSVAGNQAATNANWRRVRSLRIGMVLRGPKGSQAITQAETLYPLGEAMTAASDTGAAFTPTITTDGRLRKTFTFTVHLRNNQS